MMTGFTGVMLATCALGATCKFMLYKFTPTTDIFCWQMQNCHPGQALVLVSLFYLRLTFGLTGAISRFTAVHCRSQFHYRFLCVTYV